MQREVVQARARDRQVASEFGHLRRVSSALTTSGVDVSRNSRRIALHDGIGRYVVGDHGACANHGVRPNRQPGQDGGVGADRRAMTNYRARKRVKKLAAARERIVGECGVGTDEDIVFQRDAIPDLHAALDGDSVTDDDVVLNEYAVTNIAVGADAGAREHMGKGPNPSASSDVLALYQSVRVFEVVRHSGCVVVSMRLN